MTNLRCTACADYEPPNCKCMCHEIMRHYKEAIEHEVEERADTMREMNEESK